MIQPIKNRNFTNHILQPIKKFTLKRKSTIKNIPLVTTPLISYYTNPKFNEKSRQSKFLEEQDKAHQPISDRTEYNTRAMERAGYNKQEIKKALDQDGYIKDASIQKDLRSKNISFKSSETQNSEELPDYMMSSEVDTEVATSDRINIHNLVDNPSLQKHMTIKDIERMDTSMCPELEEYTSKPVEEVPDGLMSNILDDLPEGFEVSDEGLFNTLKGYMQQLTEWLGE